MSSVLALCIRHGQMENFLTIVLSLFCFFSPPPFLRPEPSEYWSGGLGAVRGRVSLSLAPSLPIALWLLRMLKGNNVFFCHGHIGLTSCVGCPCIFGTRHTSHPKVRVASSVFFKTGGVSLYGNCELGWMI